jgi:hypothetical protein
VTIQRNACIETQNESFSRVNLNYAAEVSCEVGLVAPVVTKQWSRETLREGREQPLIEFDEAGTCFAEDSESLEPLTGLDAEEAFRDPARQLT